MINSVEQYKYVVGADVDEAHPHGDLDRIIIDGEVMPLRTGDTGKVDKDGNAISRQKILRGEDIAFLIEAVGQRHRNNWWTARMWPTSDEAVIETNQLITKFSFSRKVSAKQLRYLWEMVDSVCDTAVVNLNFKEKVSGINMGFENVYGKPGLPEAFRVHRKFTAPANGDALPHSDSIAALFVTESAMACADFGAPPFWGGYSLNFEIEGDDMFADASGGHPYLSWGVESCKMCGFEYGKTFHKSGTMFCYPNPGYAFFGVRAPHVAEMLIIVEVIVSKSIDNEYKSVWLPITVPKNGEWFTMTTDACGFCTKDSVVSICEKSGIGVPDAPSGDDSGGTWRNSVKVRLSIGSMRLFGRWDDHTKWR